jgi:hypothetical protein
MILYSSGYDLNQVAHLPYAGRMKVNLMKRNTTLAFTAHGRYDDCQVPICMQQVFNSSAALYDFNHKGPLRSSVILCCNQ